jgi:flagellar hook-length control protein FliK
VNPAPSTPAIVAETAAAAPGAADDVIAPQIVRSLRLVAQDGGGEARVRLKPEYLGEVLIVLKVDQGAVTASLQAESPAVRQWAETHEHVLRQSLSAQGLRLDQFTVHDTAESSSTSERRSDGGPASSRDQQPPPRRPRSEADGEAERFEVVL